MKDNDFRKPNDMFGLNMQMFFALFLHAFRTVLVRLGILAPIDVQYVESGVDNLPQTPPAIPLDNLAERIDYIQLRRHNSNPTDEQNDDVINIRRMPSLQTSDYTVIVSTPDNFITPVVIEDIADDIELEDENGESNNSEVADNVDEGSNDTVVDSYASHRDDRSSISSIEDNDDEHSNLDDSFENQEDNAQAPLRLRVYNAVASFFGGNEESNIDDAPVDLNGSIIYAQSTNFVEAEEQDNSRIDESFISASSNIVAESDEQGESRVDSADIALITGATVSEELETHNAADQHVADEAAEVASNVAINSNLEDDVSENDVNAQLNAMDPTVTLRRQRAYTIVDENEEKDDDQNGSANILGTQLAEVTSANTMITSTSAETQFSVQDPNNVTSPNSPMPLGGETPDSLDNV